jgi:uncharacterized membrane protein
MSGNNVVLYAATYHDPAAAGSDYEELKSAVESSGLEIEGSVVVSRDDEGKVTVKETGGGQVPKGALLGGGVGILVGLFAPPLLLSAAVGAGIGAIGGELAKHHDEKTIGLDVEEYLPEGSSAILVVMEDVYLDRVERTLAHANERISKAVDSGDYAKIRKALEKSATEVQRAVDS